MPNPADQPNESRPGEHLAGFLRGDAAFEPPASALASACALRSRIAARRAPDASAFAKIGELLDIAGARVVDWLGLSPDRALAGVRDDRGDEFVDAAIPGSGVAIVAERTVGEDARVRFVGEFRGADGAPVRGRLAVLDAQNRVLVEEELDAFGMFSIRLPADARRVAFARREAQGRDAHARDATSRDLIVVELAVDPDGGSRGRA